MKVSLNTIRQYIDFELPAVDELVARINEQLGQVEEVIDVAAKYSGAVIVKVVEAEQHPNADRLRVCKVDDGGAVADVPRDENGYVQVVCGAPNVHADMMAVWLPPNTTVPASFDEDEPFILSARELRGVLSQGMLAAADELAIGSDHEGIVEIDPAEWNPNGVEIVPGANFAKAFGLDDMVIDIENKMFTHRPDCFGQLGVAREIAGILGHTFTSPEWYWNLPEFIGGEGLKLELFNEASDKVPRFMAVALSGVTVRPSPFWLQCELVRLGSKPINNIVDATNYVMLLTAQPTHAYDYDKLHGAAIGARMAKDGETTKLLNGKTYTLTADDIVIADKNGVIGLAGIMGGGESEVSADTTNIVLEVASFDMYAVRKSSMRHGIFTDALTRFNKGQSPLQNDRVLQLLMKSVTDMAGGAQAGTVFDLRSLLVESGYEDQSLHEPLSVTNEFINERLGTALSLEEVAATLGSVEIAAREEGGALTVRAPFWRTDLELPEDIVEEVGRLYGFDMLSRTLPQRTTKPASYNASRIAKARIRQSLARAGANEVLTYSFVHERLLKNSGQNPEKAFRLSNALSPDLQYYRLSVVPSLIDKIHQNMKVGYGEFALFEIGKAHHLDEFDSEGLPKEFGRVGGVYASKQSKDGAPYYAARRIVEQLFADFYLIENLRFAPLQEFEFSDHDAFRQLAAPFEPARSATVWIGKQLAGVVGEFVPSVKKQFKLPEYTAGFELFMSPFASNATSVPTYRPLNRFPSLRQDLSMKMGVDYSYDAVYAAAFRSARALDSGLNIGIEPVSIYRPENDTTHRTITLRFTVVSDSHTLTDKEVTALIDIVATKLQEEFQAQRI